MAPSPNSPDSIWYQPTEVLYGPNVSQVEELFVIWDRPAFRVHATVVAEHGVPVVRAFTCEALTGTLPPDARRLPTDAVIIDAVRRVGFRGIGPLIRLLGEESAFEARYAAVETTDDQSPLERAAAEHGAIIVRRPRAQIQQQIVEVQRMREKGMRTSQIERELMTRFGLSKRTAYRRIESAKDAQQSRVPTGGE